MKIADHASLMFFGGTFGLVYPRDFIKNMLSNINTAKAKEGSVTTTFDQGATSKDAVIQVTLRIVKKSVLDKEEQGK